LKGPVKEPVFLATDAALEGDKSLNINLIVKKYSEFSGHLTWYQNVTNHHLSFWNELRYSSLRNCGVGLLAILRISEQRKAKNNDAR
jgi:hypothetical protein